MSHKIIHFNCCNFTRNFLQCSFLTPLALHSCNSYILTHFSYTQRSVSRIARHGFERKYYLPLVRSILGLISRTSASSRCPAKTGPASNKAAEYRPFTECVVIRNARGLHSGGLRDCRGAARRNSSVRIVTATMLLLHLPGAVLSRGEITTPRGSFYPPLIARPRN